jgi:hypothetical protein
VLARPLLDPDSDIKRPHVNDRASLEFAAQNSRKRREVRTPEAAIGAGTAWRRFRASDFAASDDGYELRA